jgi:hypothetical protein
MITAWFDHEQRKEDWLIELRRVLAEWRTKEFVWGQTDCFCFAGAAIKALVGHDPMDGVKGVYASEKGAYDVLYNGAVLSDGNFYQEDGLVGFWSYWLGEPQEVGLAQRGDIVVCKLPDGSTVTGVMGEDGKKIWAMCHPKGMVQLPLKWGVLSWRV